jgi:hypothetical protein
MYACYEKSRREAASSLSGALLRVLHLFGSEEGSSFKCTKRSNEGLFGSSEGGAKDVYEREQYDNGTNGTKHSF